jgi:DNA repair protein RadA/Sms
VEHHRRGRPDRGHRRRAEPRARSKGRPVALTTLDGEIEDAPRIESGIAELDRVTGGGFVRGSALLVGGDPGIGKSTLLMQAAAALARAASRRLRLGRRGGGAGAAAGQRLGAGRCAPVLNSRPKPMSRTSSPRSPKGKRPDLVIIDSIQTLWTDTRRIRARHGDAGARLGAGDDPLRQADRRGVVLVGHVTKDGQIAGPAWSSTWSTRCSISRAKAATTTASCAREEPLRPDRRDRRVRDVGQGPARGANPSELFLGERDAAPGTAVFAGMEGTRPVLVEIQALVAPTSLGTPRRAVVGWDSARLSMVLAVLEAHCGVRLGATTSISTSPAAIASTSRRPIWRSRRPLVSPRSGRAGLALPRNWDFDCVYFGEISLSGRPISTATPCARSAACSAFWATRKPRRSPRSACTRCSIAGRKRRASSASTAHAVPLRTPARLVGDTFTEPATAGIVAACPATWRSAMSAIRPPAKPSCATCSRCSPNSKSAASPSPITATSPTA